MLLLLLSSGTCQSGHITTGTVSIDGLAAVDPAAVASLAGQLGVLPQLALLSKQTWTGPVAGCITQALLNVACAIIAAFDLSPFTLPADQLQALVDMVSNLYEGESLHVEVMFTCMCESCCSCNTYTLVANLQVPT